MEALAAQPGDQNSDGNSDRLHAGSQRLFRAGDPPPSFSRHAGLVLPLSPPGQCLSHGGFSSGRQVLSSSAGWCITPRCGHCIAHVGAGCSRARVQAQTWHARRWKSRLRSSTTGSWSSTPHPPQAGRHGGVRRQALPLARSLWSGGRSDDRPGPCVLLFGATRGQALGSGFPPLT